MLLIKGDSLDAQLEAECKRIKLHEVKTNNQYREVRAWTDDDNERIVRQWFNETSDLGPYPPGTLLWFRTSKDDA